MTEILPGTMSPAGEAPAVQFPVRAVASPELIDTVTGVYELDWTGETTDVGDWAMAVRSVNSPNTKMVSGPSTATYGSRAVVMCWMRKMRANRT